MTGIQQVLNFDCSQPPSILTLNGMVYELLRSSGDWWCPWEICNVIHNRYQVKISDSSATARLRDLRKPQYGAHTILKRKRPDSHAYEYALGDTR